MTPSRSSTTGSGRTALVLGLSAAQLVTWGSVFYTFALLAAPVEQALGLSRAESSLAFSLALLAEGLCAYPVGRWIDRGHERVVMTGGSLLVGTGLALHAFVDQAWAFLAVWTLIGAGLAGTLYSPAFAVVTRRFPHDFRRAIITLTFLGGLASTVFIPLSDWLIDARGWREALLWLAGLQFLLCAPLHARLLRGAARAVVPSDPGPPHEPVAGSTTAPLSPANRPLSAHLRSAPFLLIGVFTVLMMAVTAALPAHLINLLRERGLSEAWVIAVPASIGAIQVLGRVLLYLFEHRFDVHRSNALIPCLIPLGLLCLLAGGVHVVGAWLFVAFYGLGNGMLTIVKGTAMAQYVSRAHVASLNGALGVPMALARAAAPLALGLMWDPAGGYRSGLWALLAASVLAIGALWQAQRRSRA